MQTTGPKFNQYFQIHESISTAPRVEIRDDLYGSSYALCLDDREKTSIPGAGIICHEAGKLSACLNVAQLWLEVATLSASW